MHRNQSLTAHLGERVRSALPGYAVSLAASPLVGSETSAPARAVIVEISQSALQCVCWVADADDSERAWASRIVEVRVVLRSEEFAGEIVAMVGASVDLDEFVDDDVNNSASDHFDLPEILTAVKDAIEVDLVNLVPDLDPPVAAELGRALRIYVNDPIRG
jgi:hypothetical protein